ncbi:uncharacterized protein LOC118512938 [Anopheles stephensi]|uniref:uncharacterized protein LOC118512938 n=1 Tax=Anopheles stephensi TaxID=30069 RepID=UPI00165894FA|nr:uncharacterized protein LOC118512938 [Anopheles stephensi]
MFIGCFSRWNTIASCRDHHALQDTTSRDSGHTPFLNPTKQPTAPSKQQSIIRCKWNDPGKNRSPDPLHESKFRFTHFTTANMPIKSKRPGPNHQHNLHLGRGQLHCNLHTPTTEHARDKAK